jgi:hypothetical protein
MGATSGAGTAYPSGEHVFTPVFGGVRVTRSLVLCVCFVDRFSPFVLFLAIVLSVLHRFMDYPFGILKLFFHGVLIFYDDSKSSNKASRKLLYQMNHQIGTY